ncbi:MAG: hypothetical protein AB7V77_00170 [Candidatus Woesearchaeota archaeon]
MVWFQYLVLLGALAQLVGITLYIKETVKGIVKPNRMTWLMWSIAPLIASTAAFVDGVTWAALPVFMAGFGPFLVFISSFLSKKAYWKLESVDYWFGAFSAIGLILWAITKEPSIAIIFAILADGFAALPTLTKAWKHPQTEHSSAFSTGLFSALTSFTAVKSWSFSEIAFPCYLILICSSILFAINRKKLFNHKITN